MVKNDGLHIPPPMISTDDKCKTIRSKFKDFLYHLKPNSTCREYLIDVNPFDKVLADISQSIAVALLTKLANVIVSITLPIS